MSEALGLGQVLGRLLEIAATDALSLDLSIAKVRAVIAVATVLIGVADRPPSAERRHASGRT